MTPLDAMKQALEALDAALGYGTERVDSKLKEAITNLSIAIAEMEKAEPVAWLHSHRSESDVITNKVKRVWGGVAVGKEAQYTIPLFAHPTQSRDSIIEECAAIADRQPITNSISAAIRALKGKK